MSEQQTSQMVDPAVKIDSSGSSNMGMIRGVPGKRIENLGVLDLRGVPVEEVQQIESISNCGAVLTDGSQRAALAGVRVENVGTVAEIGADYRVLVEPWMEFSRATVEAMPPGQKLALVGIILFKPDVTPAAVAEKFEEGIAVGIVMASAGVQGALMGRLQITGVSVTIPEHGGQVVHNIGHQRLTAGYLGHLEDGCLYVNVGHVEIAEEVTEELLARKIAAYCNIGHTQAAAPLVDLLKARCSTNLGHFSISGEDDGG